MRYHSQHGMFESCLGLAPILWTGEMASYGKYRIDRITEVVEEFIKCGDYKEGLARIKCTSPDCGHDYFVPLSCKGFYLCPSCHQKRTLLFSEQITQEVLLMLPHRQWVFCIPKCLRVFFKHDRMLFSDISRLISKMLQSYYEISAIEVYLKAVKQPISRSFRMGCEAE